MAPDAPKDPCRTRLAVALAALAAWFLGLAGWILAWSHPHDPPPADAIVVLGAAAHGTTPSPVFEGRLEHALDLFRRRKAPRLVLTGGRPPGAPAAESSVARSWLLSRGVPPTAILSEEVSTTTAQNLSEAARLLAASGPADPAPPRVILVSDPYHMARSRLLALRHGLVPATSPTPSTRIQSAGPRLRFLARECFFSTLALLRLD